MNTDNPDPTDTSPAKIRQGLRAGGAPGTPWPLIKLRFEDGDTFAQIARTFSISDEAVRKRAASEGWSRNPNPHGLRDLANSIPTASNLTPGLPDADQITTLLTALTAGVNLHLAARAAGIHNIDQLLSSDPQLAATTTQAAAAAISRKIERINAAGERGDWKADAYLLERLPESRPTFGNNPSSSNSGVTVIINFDRDSAPTGSAPTGITIDQNPDEQL